MSEQQNHMSTPAITFTGERYMPECTGEMQHEHWHRYAFASSLVEGLEVLDIASGEGYGSALLAQQALRVIGIDIDAQAITHAQHRYVRENLQYQVGSAAAIPLEDASVDVVVSFETLEHLEAQAEMMQEIRRVLRPDGFLVLSSPNKALYSDARNHQNPYHVRELYRDELSELLTPVFPAQAWVRQRGIFASMMWPEIMLSTDDRALPTEWLFQTAQGAQAHHELELDAMYFVVVAAAHPGCLPWLTRFSVLTDTQQSVYQQFERSEREVLRLDQLLGQRDESLALRTQQMQEREQLIQERDQQLLAVNARAEKIEAHLLERDEELAAINARTQQIEAHLQERDAMLAQRTVQMETLQAELAQRDAQLEHLHGDLAHRNLQVQALQTEVALRGSWSWWLKLPIKLLTGKI